MNKKTAGALLAILNDSGEVDASALTTGADDRAALYLAGIELRDILHNQIAWDVCLDVRSRKIVAYYELGLLLAGVQAPEVAA